MIKFDALNLKDNHNGCLFFLEGKIKMTKRIDVIHLNRKYFEDNSHFKNMLDENNVPKQVKRPYVYVSIKVKDNNFLLPLRSNLNHPNGFHAPSSKSANAGIDYSHALILPESSYIKNRTDLDREQYDYIKDNYDTIKSEFVAYLKDYIRKEKKGIAHKVGKFKNSTLLNFNEELGLVKELEKPKEKDKKETQEKIKVQDKVETKETKVERDHVKIRERVAVINREGVQETPGKQDEVKIQKKTVGQDQEDNRDEQRKRERRLAYMRQMGRER